MKEVMVLVAMLMVVVVIDVGGGRGGYGGAIPYQGNHHNPQYRVNTNPNNLETTKPPHKSPYKLFRVVVKAVVTVRLVNLIVVLVLH